MQVLCYSLYCTYIGALIVSNRFSLKPREIYIKFLEERTGTATAKAVESSDTINTVMLRAIKESQKESGFFDVSTVVPASSSDPGIIIG